MENHNDNKKSVPLAMPPGAGSSGSKSAQQKTAKLARALKDNLQRRKQVAPGNIKADA